MPHVLVTGDLIGQTTIKLTERQVCLKAAEVLYKRNHLPEQSFYDDQSRNVATYDQFGSALILHGPPTPAQRDALRAIALLKDVLP